MTLHSRLKRLERDVAALQARRAQQTARMAAYHKRFPTLFDRWWHAVEWARACPADFPDEELLRRLLKIGRAIGIIYFEEGSDALRAWLRDQRYEGDHHFTEEEIERIVSWCRMKWTKGSPHPLSPSLQVNWLELEYGPLSEEQRTEFTERAHRFPYPYDVLAKEAAKASASVAPPPPQTTFQCWLARLQTAWAAPMSIADPEQARLDLRAARTLGTIYYERGGLALRSHLRETGYDDGHVSDAEIEQILAWCRRSWGPGSSHPWTRREPSNWLEFEFGPQPAALWDILEQGTRAYSAPADVLAEEAA